jgi:hypothetical protein
VAYTPDWEPLAEALKRVMAAGIKEDEAKTDLCRAMADRKINVRVTIAATDYGMRGQVFIGGNVGVPPHLRPGDLDWAQSRPFAQWQIGPQLGEHYSWITGWGNRPLDLIELCTADVIEVLCHGAGGGRSLATARDETAAIAALAKHLKSNSELTRAEAAAWCKQSGLRVSERGFQSRVWPKAREQAGLEALAPAGRKKKSTQRSP